MSVEERLMYKIVMYKERKEGKGDNGIHHSTEVIIGEKRWDFSFFSLGRERRTGKQGKDTTDFMSIIYLSVCLSVLVLILYIYTPQLYVISI